MMSTPGKLNRSHSESELYPLNLENLCIQDRGPPTTFEGNVHLVKKTILIVEEVYRHPVMSRYGRSVPNHLHNIEKIHSNTIILNSSVLANDSNIRLNSEEQPASQTLNFDNSDETVPMDIDSISDNSKPEKCSGVIENMDVDLGYNYKDKRLSSLDGVLKKRTFHVGSILPKESIKNNTHINPILCEKNEFGCNSIISIVLVVLLLLGLGLWIFQGDIVLYVNSDIQLQNIRQDLLEQVYDQKGPVSIIIRSLEHRSRWANKIKVLGFIGSAGVGKTFVTNILKKHFHSRLVHELYGIQLDFRSQWEKILSRLKSCCLNLIIIDDLSKKDTTILFELVYSLPENYYILVISVFNIQYSDDLLNYVINFDDIDEIRHEFDNSGVFHELAVFNQFNMHQVKDWLKKQLKVQNMPYSDKFLNILYNHNASYEGLKGLHSKLLLELEGKNEFK